MLKKIREIYDRLEIKRIRTIVVGKGSPCVIVEPSVRNSDPFNVEAKIHTEQYAKLENIGEGKPSMMYLLKPTGEAKHENEHSSDTKGRRNDYEAFLLPIEKQYPIGTIIRGEIEEETYIIHKSFKTREHGLARRYLLGRGF